MVVKERQVPRQKTHVADIRGTAEREFFLFIKRYLPKIKIVFEPTEFSDPDSIRSTVPDFLITKADGTEIYIEITTETYLETTKQATDVDNGPKEKQKDPKEKQKEIMRKHPNTRYVVLYGNNLMSIQKKHPEARFFDTKKIRK